jgi:hypothetical protein
MCLYIHFQSSLLFIFSRKEKKRCKMSSNDEKDPKAVSFESEDEDDDVEEIDMDDSSIVYLSDDDDIKKDGSPNVVSFFAVVKQLQ